MCVCERERESESVCVCVYASVSALRKPDEFSLASSD